MFSRRMSRFTSAAGVLVVVCALAVFLAGCLHTPIVTTPIKGGEQLSVRNILPIADVLKNSSHAVIVLVHGVGEHCPGYGLDGWLGPNAAKFGLQPAANLARQSVNLYNLESVRDGKLDPGSIMILTRERFQFTPAAMAAAGLKDVSPNVDVAEITWTGISEWLKLGTLTEDWSTPYTYGPCEPTSTTAKTVSLRGSRAVLTTDIKEDVIDHSISDALIYVGPYGDGIQATMKLALCLVTTDADLVQVQPQGNPENPKCQWNDAKKGTRFVFFTHSLGSRIVFDAAFNLRSDVARTSNDLDRQQERDSSENKIVTAMLCKTQAIYMFANQLPLIALSYAQRDAQSGDESDTPLAPNAPPAVTPTTNTNTSATAASASDDASTKSNQPAQKVLNVQLKDSRIALKRLRRTCPEAMPEVVAFSDPDDILSYGIPYRYTDGGSNLPMASDQHSTGSESVGGKNNVHVTNVYVRNHFNWFGLMEAPGAAHSDYFINPDVQEAIRCGINGHDIVRCSK